MKTMINHLHNARAKLLVTLLALIGLGVSSAHAATIVVINGFEFDLAQFDNAEVTYRPDGSVTFDGKLWDNANGVDGFTLGELAAGQFGSDPGDQISLNDRTTPDWLILNYGLGTGIEISATAHELVIYEISSSTSVDPEGTSFRVGFNGSLVLIEASAATSITNFGPGDNDPENVNQLVFDLYDFGFSNGDIFQSLYIENKDTGSGTSDPDFIFAGIAGTLTASVPEPGSALLLALGLLGFAGGRRLIRTRA
jgi:hypothetical protein